MATITAPVEVVAPQKVALFEISVSKQELMHELQIAQGVAERKTTIPILSNFLFVAEDGRLNITATDLNQSIKSSCPAAVRVEGRITVPGRKFFEYVRLLPDGNITLKALPNGWVQIRSGRSNTKMVGMDAKAFPETPLFPEAGFLTLPASVMKGLLPRVVYAVSTEESRYTLAGALMILNSDSLSLVATDGHRLAYIQKKDEPFAAVIKEEKHLIPRPAVLQLMSLLSNMQDGTVDFASDDTTLFFRIQERVYTARKMTGNFPNFEAVLPKENKLIVIVNVNELAASIQRVGQFADERSQCVRFKLGENEMTISSSVAESGESEDVISTPYSGQAFTVGFNYPYIIDFLKSIAGTEEVRMEFKDASTAMIMRPQTSEILYGYECVLMPMRIG